MKVVAGCDGGGTKCLVRAALCDDAGNFEKTADGIAGPANVSTDADSALLHIQQAAALAKQQLGLDERSPFDALVAGLAGAGRPELQRVWTGLLRDHHLASHVEVVPDPAILFAAADVTGPAVISVIGTGSIAWARDAKNVTARAGGLGPKLGDEGSAYWIAHRALSTTATTDSQLVKLAMRRFQCEPSDIAKLVVEGSPQQVASFTSDVFAAANTDDVAQAIVADAVRYISEMMVQVTRQLTDLDSAASPLDWICAGGVALNQPQFLASVRGQCGSQGLDLKPPLSVREPVVGALRLAANSLAR